MPQRRAGDGRSGVFLRWLGIAGWELAFDGHSLLIDPYLTRQAFTTDGAMDLNRKLVTDPDAIEWVVTRHLTRAPEFILVTHGHWDHMADVPHLLGRGGPGRANHRIRVLCGETHWHLLTAMGLPRGQQADMVLVTGGEHLRYPLHDAEHPRPDYTIEVFRSLHSQLGGYGFSPAGTLTEPPKPAPKTLADLVEGGTLGYQITIGDRLRVMFLSGTANFSERDIAGARPDVLVLGASGHAAVHDYFERALATLGWPAVIVPSHHDDLVTPLDSPDLPDTVDHTVVTELQQVLGDRGTVLDPQHLVPIEL